MKTENNSHNEEIILRVLNTSSTQAIFYPTKIGMGMINSLVKMITKEKKKKPLLLRTNMLYMSDFIGIPYYDEDCELKLSIGNIYKTIHDYDIIIMDEYEISGLDIQKKIMELCIKNSNKKFILTGDLMRCNFPQELLNRLFILPEEDEKVN